MAFITDIADEIWRDSGQDSIHSIPSIAAWLRFSGNLGNLNTLINTDFIVDSSSLEIVSESTGIKIRNAEVGIYKLLYFETFYQRKENSSLGAAGVDIISEASSDGGTLRFLNRNQIAISFNKLKKDTRININQLVNAYKSGNYRPLSSEGDDTNVILTANRLASNAVLGLNTNYGRS